jgi:hypothetical protein
MTLPLLLLLAQSVWIDAHNCYPEKGRHADRIERALQIGVPIAIEQDLAWDGKKSVVAHDPKFAAGSPAFEKHFFRRVLPILKKAPREKWPVMVLNLDFKTEQPEHLAAVWKILGRYEKYLTTAPKSGGAWTPGPLLVLTGESVKQQKVFFDDLPANARLRLFGAARTQVPKPRFDTPVEQLVTESASAYRRWWNNSWVVIEEGGQRNAGEWTREEDARLRAFTAHARKLGLMIRFYTLNGHAPEVGDRNGWTASYNTSSLEAAQVRWRACAAAGVDFIATDQYEELARVLRGR